MAESMIEVEFQKILKQYEGWMGSRPELLAIIQNIEEADPKSRMLQSKKAPYDRLPVNPRRIQWFISQGMVPKPYGHKYEYLHLVYYWATIFARKREKLQFEKLKNLKSKISMSHAERYIFGESGFEQDMKMQANLVSPQIANCHEPVEFVRRSKLLQFSITPWCHLNISEEKVLDLNDESIDEIATAVREALCRESLRSSND